MQMFQAASEAIGANIFIFDCEHQSVLATDSIAKKWGMLPEQPGVPYDLASGDMVPEDSAGIYEPDEQCDKVYPGGRKNKAVHY